MGPPFPTSPAALPQLTTGKICRARQEAVEAHFHGEAETIPAPSAPEAWASHEDFQGATG